MTTTSAKDWPENGSVLMQTATDGIGERDSVVIRREQNYAHARACVLACEPLRDPPKDIRLLLEVANVTCAAGLLGTDLTRRVHEMFARMAPWPNPGMSA